MPDQIFKPDSGDFSYITLDELRAEDISEEYIDDDRARAFIRRMSQWINLLTRQWFMPVRLNERLDAHGSSVVAAPYFIPILRLDAVKIAKPGLVLMTLPSISWERMDRYVRMLDYRAYLPSQPRFVELDGVFGWLEDDYYKEEMLLTAAVPKGSIHIPVNTIPETIEVGDVILIGDTPWPYSVPREIKAIDTALSRFLVEPTSVSITQNSKVTRFGRIPFLIKRATILLILDKGEQMGWADVECPPWFTKRLTNESVEGYSYGLTKLPVDYGPGGGEFTTGNPEVDDILQQYSSNRLYIGVV